MRFRLPLLVAVATLFFASFAQAENCTSAVLDKAGVIRGTALIAAEARPLINQGADVRIVTVDHNTFVNNGSSLTGVETYLETSCPNWTTNGVRKANLFVVMVAPQDRQKNIFLGSYYAGSFDIPSTYSALANGNFKAGQWEIGIASTLHGAGLAPSPSISTTLRSNSKLAPLLLSTRRQHAPIHRRQPTRLLLRRRLLTAAEYLVSRSS